MPLPLTKASERADTPLGLTGEGVLPVAAGGLEAAIFGTRSSRLVLVVVMQMFMKARSRTTAAYALSTESSN